LNAITASTNHAALAANRPDGRWARAESLRSAWICSMIAWPRWVLSAVMTQDLASMLDRVNAQR
jgi:hypothetical protein